MAKHDGGDLALLVDELFELVESVTNQPSDLRECWNDRLILERSSLAELYVNGRIEVLLYGEWPVAGDKVDWLCRIRPERTVGHREGAADIDSPDISQSDSGQDEVVLVVIVENVEGPQRLIRSVGRPDFIQQQVCASGQGGLYEIKLLNGLSAGGYKVFPFTSHGEMALRSPLHGIAYSGRQMVKSPSKVVDRVTDHERDQFRNWLQGAISEGILGRMRIGRDNVWFDDNLMPISRQRRGMFNYLVNVAVGPLDL